MTPPDLHDDIDWHEPPRFEEPSPPPAWLPIGLVLCIVTVMAIALWGIL